MEQSNRTVLLPVGSTEQHGPHLPLGTDTMVALTLAKDAGEKTTVPVAPPLWFGWSPHHMVLPGTITIRPEILTEMAFDIISSLNTHGFRNFVLINGHRIVNIAWLQIAGERAKRELGVNLVIFDPAFMSKSICASLGWGRVGHAEEIETAHMMYRHPDLVHMEKAIDNPHTSQPLYSVDPAFDGDTLCYVPGTTQDMAAQVQAAGGTSGQPSKASVNGGKVYHDHLVSRLVSVIQQML
jgi:creatinine amidohydrolase